MLKRWGTFKSQVYGPSFSLNPSLSSELEKVQINVVTYPWLEACFFQPLLQRWASLPGIWGERIRDEEVRVHSKMSSLSFPSARTLSNVVTIYWKRAYTSKCRNYLFEVRVHSKMSSLSFRSARTLSNIVTIYSKRAYTFRCHHFLFFKDRTYVIKCCSTCLSIGGM